MRLLTVSALAIVAAACRTPAAAGDSGVSATVDSRGYDITVLQAWISDATAAIRTGGQSDSLLGATYLLQRTACSNIHSSTSTTNSGTYTSVEADCTNELADKARLDGGPSESPVINRAVHAYEIRQADNAVLVRTGKCELVEFRTVTRDTALNAATFRGIGFHFGGYATPGDFVAKDRLHAVGRVTLKDGSPATVHRFIAQGMCFGTGGNGGSIFSRRYNFRPYAQFEEAGNAYRVWDEVPTDYHLGRKIDGSHAWIKNFDRQSEILQQ